MPSYDFECKNCKHQFEARISMSDQNPNCLSCGGQTAKIFLSAPATHGYMARGREEAMQSLQPKLSDKTPAHGSGCQCGHH